MGDSKIEGGFIFDIQGFSVHDGPGCRTLIFFKGCSLHCAWCSNPEGISPRPEILYHSSRCIHDGLCIQACPYGAIAIQDDKNNDLPEGKNLNFDRSVCARCHTFQCVSACCTGAINTGGYAITIDELYHTITRDRQYWGSRGGITLTGGEPFFQPGFAYALLQRCYGAYIHTAAETCGNIPWNNIAPSLPFLDWLFFDLKHMDPDRHFHLTRSDNHQILSNATRLAGEFKGRLIFRMPVIPGFNEETDNIGAMIRFIHSTGRDEINLLPAHHLGREKYNLLGKGYFTDNYDPPLPEKMESLKHRFEAAGIHCYISSDTPF
ncbi:MAG: glycyl-radical enzyme activating protein [Bacteroidales bacterium]|nr:glycyl-radical enzyme activating protein [Bacteroidales bacterium]